MTRHGKIPDDVAQQLQTNRSHTHGICDKCGKEARNFVEDPRNPNRLVCESCEASVYMEREGIDEDEYNA